jgi:hypothetical protein
MDRQCAHRPLRWLAALALLLCSAGSAAQNAASRVVTLDQDTRARREPFTVSILNGPASVTTAVVRLSREGRTYSIAASYSPPAGGSPVGIVVVRELMLADAQDLPLGKYQVVAELDGTPFPAPPTRLLEVVPPGNPQLRLDEFEPSSTDRRRSAYFAVEGQPGLRQPGPVETPVVQLGLRGSGFQTDVPTDNIIYVNRLPVARVEAGRCGPGDYGTSRTGVRRETIARVASAEEIEVCRVIPPPNGELRVQVRVGDRYTEPRIFRAFSQGKAPVALASGAIALALAAIPLLLLRALKNSYAVAPGRRFKSRLLFLDPETNTYSLSKLQFYLWTVAALFGYAYLFISHVFVQGLTWPDVPATLPGIIAVAAGTSIGAQVITVARGSKGAGETEPNVSDFITTGGVVALDRVQMLVWTIFGVGAFIVAALRLTPGLIPELPAIPEHLLYLSGLSSLGYLGGKLARKAGPVINEIATTPADPDDAIANQDAAQAQGPDLATAIATAKRVSVNLTTSAEPAAKDAVGAFTEAIALASAAQTTADFDKLVDELTKLRAKADLKAEQAAVAYAAETDAARKADRAKDAATAERAAGALQALSAEVTQAIAVAAASPMLAIDGPRMIARTITLRGTNLSPDGLLTIDAMELPFRMLTNVEGKHEPDILAREDTPTLARVLKLTIDPARLAGSDLTQFHKWFATSGTHTFALTNIDGQKAELRFSLPPGLEQK